MQDKNNNRRKFLTGVLGTAAVIALNPIEVLFTHRDLFASGGNQTLGTVTLNLNLSTFNALKTVGGSKEMTLPSPNSSIKLLIIRVDASTFSVLTSTCTHVTHCTVGLYNKSSQLIVCSCHGSEYAIDGALVQGPAPSALHQYPSSYDTVNNILTITDPAITTPAAVANDPFNTILFQNYPNPVQGLTTIRFTLGYGSRVVVTVTDIIGNTIAVLTDGTLGEGDHSYNFDASIFPAGTYFYHLRVDTDVLTKQMLIVK